MRLGGDHIDAKRFVVCVASSARRAEIIEELARQRETRDLAIDLYDQERLSQMLKQRGDLVRRLFGEEWERLFCGGMPASAPTRLPADVLADGILRGPLEALGLANQATVAHEEREAKPSHAADSYGRLAEALEKSPFAGFAETYRLQQAECSVRAGDVSTAVRLLAEVAWAAVEFGLSGRVAETVRRLEQLARETGSPPSAGMLALAFKAVERWSADPFYDLEDIGPIVAQLVDTDAPGAPQATRWLAETAVASENYDLVRRLSRTLEAVASAREARSESDEIAVRLRACLADATGDWEYLCDRALRGRLGRRQAALVHARRGRYLAWNCDPEGADKSYRLAIDQACQANMNGEAAAALHSIWTVGVHYGLPEDEWGGAVDLSKTIQVAGGDYLRSVYDHRAVGLAELADGKLASALGHLRANLRSSIVSGRLASEIDAHSLLGKLYSRAGEFGLAVRHHIRAGDAKVLEELLPIIDAYVDCTNELDRRAPWECATALSALASQGDLIPDDQVDQLVRTALARSSGERQGIFTPWVWLSAYKLLAALGPRVPIAFVDPILDLLQPLIEREPNRYRHNDDQHVRIVASLFLAHPERRDRTGQHLLALMAASPDLGTQVLKVGWDALEAGREFFVDGLRRLANDGSSVALEALLCFEDNHPLLIAEAQRLLENTLNRPGRKPGHYTIGSARPRTAAFVRLLEEEKRVGFAEAAMREAEDSSEMEVNRGNAIHAVTIVADSLPDPVRRSLFARAMSLARDPGSSAEDEHLKAGLHPLSRFRVNLGVGSLVPQAVCAAGGLAHTREQYEAVIEAASALFRTGDEFAANQAGHALSCLPPGEAQVDVRLLAASPVGWARQLAAVLWARVPDQAPSLGKDLAGDAYRGVRQALASSLSTLREKRPGLADELAELLRKDSSASVRGEVRRVK